ALDPARVEASGPAIDLEDWAAETKPLLQAALPRFVSLECRIAPGLSVRVARHLLAQAIFNLVQNAGEAIAGRSTGIVRITAERVPGAGSARGLVRIRVSDDGPGMTPAVLARCFEPYFSTKGRAISTGMGLGLVKGIVEAAGGSVTVESVLGSGTTFTILLPMTTSRGDGESTGNAAACGAVSVRDPRVASLTCMLLEQLGVSIVRHAGPGTPTAELWVTDDTEKLTAAYLEEGEERRLVALTDLPPIERGRWRSRFGSMAERVVILPPSPTPGELRDALASSIARAAPDSGGER
ncbi:MAG TPA: HAMP domain-containing sensor histidine kinase, partial [Phycisphaerales bacterium]|nr:HAMP domain-containing sensor histidine kinase [Phycisphaerales bacterium]